MYSAILKQVELHQFDLIAVLIIAAWGLSPIGGQSALRLLLTPLRAVDSSPTINYMSIEASKATWISGADAASEGWPSYAPIFLAALLDARTDQNSTVDAWGNVKIPDMKTLQANNTLTMNGKTWLSVDHSKTVTYSSLLGVPVAGIPRNGNSTFEIISRYSELECANRTQYPTFFWDSSNISTFGMNETNTTFTNFTASGVQSFDLASIMMSANGFNTSGAVLQCSVRVRDVSSLVRCQSQNCLIQGMRDSPVRVEQRLGVDFISYSNMLNMLPVVAVGAKSHAVTALFGSSPIERWLVDPSTNFAEINTFVNISTVPLPLFTSRLQMVYNTFWQSSYGAEFRFGNIPDNHTVTSQVDRGIQFDGFNTTQGFTFSFDGEMYVCNKAYAGLLIIISIMLVVVGIAGVVLKAITLAPDIIGFASTSVRDNPYCVPGNRAAPSSADDGLDYAVALKDVRVMIGDVRHNTEVGHIAFTTEGAGGDRLVKGRKYN